MSGDKNTKAHEAVNDAQATAKANYDIALPALQTKQGFINAGIYGGESALMKDAFSAERASLTEVGAANADTTRRAQLEGGKRAVAGGNVNAGLTPEDIGSKLAAALYGSKYREGQADLLSKINFMSMAAGGAGDAGNAALNASGMNLGAIRYLPDYNKTYANIVGGASAAATIYGGLNDAYPQLFGKPGTTNTGAVLPPSTIYPSTFS